MNHHEDKLQAESAALLHWKYRDLLAWHTPNGGKRDAREAARLKGQGVRAGVPDWTFVFPSGLCGFIELKWGDNRQTEGQRDFERIVSAFGCPYAVCRTLAEFEAVLEGWKARGFFGASAFDADIRNSIAVRSRDIFPPSAPWGGLLAALAQQITTYPDPQFYTEQDARILQAIAAEVRRRVDKGAAERKAAPAMVKATAGGAAL